MKKENLKKESNSRRRPKNADIKIKTPEEIEYLRRAGKILAVIIRDLKRSLKIGMTTQEIDSKAESLIAANGVLPAFKGYRGFPGCACVSVNEEVVHGVPGNRIVKPGDIVSIDVGIVSEKFFVDTAFTVSFGDIGSELKKMLEVTRESLYKGIEQARVDRHLSDISFAVQEAVEVHNFSVVRDFVGHGIGRALHEDPEIPNFGPPHQGPMLREGMVLAIEPMVNLGNWQTEVRQDGWTVVTKDGKPSAHFEHTVVVQKSGPEILTEDYG